MERRRKRIVAACILIMLAAVAGWWGAVPSAGRFQQQFVRRLLAHFPDSRVFAREPLSIECDYGHGLTTLRLQALYRAWNHQPSRRASLVDNYLTSLARTREVGDYGGVSRRIFPLLKHRSYLRLPARKDDHLAYKPFFGELVIVYCVEFPDRTVYLSGRQLALWNISLAQLHGCAVENLLARTRQPYRPTGSPWLYAFLQGDGYDASRILIWPRLRPRCGSGEGPVYAAIPHRDAFYVLNPGGLANMRVPLDNLRALAGHLYRSSHKGLIPDVLIIDGAEITSLEIGEPAE